MHFKKAFFLTTLLFVTQVIFGQNFTADFIKSVSLHSSNPINREAISKGEAPLYKMYEPVLKIGETIQISFDDLEADQKDYYYKIEHCNYNWDVSNINTTQYIDGYDSFDIQNFENSFNTLQNFTHYSFQIPNINTRIKISGNYLLTVFNSDDEICIQRRFVLFEPTITFSAEVVRDREVKNIDEKQLLQFSVYHPSLQINNPSRELKIDILQNNDWNFAKRNIKPQFYKKDEIVYRYNDKTSFYGGNEFLNFDTKNVNGSHVSILTTVLEDGYFHTLLYPNIPRAFSPYTYFPDINGNSIIRTLNGSDIKTEADYTAVHFSLEVRKETPDTPIYVYGAYNNYETNEENRLVFNDETKLLEKTILFKQGFHNYVFASKNENEILEKRVISGSHYQTENEYTLLAYYFPFGGRVGRVIGSSTIYSNF